MALDGDDPPDDDPDGPDAADPDAAPDDPADYDGAPVSDEALRAFLALPATLARAARLMAARMPRQDAADQAALAVERALRAPRRPLEPRMQPWFDRICARVAARYHRLRASRARFEGEMPEAPTRKDEAGLPIDDSDESCHVDADPSASPETDGFQARGLLLRRWFAKATAGSPRDRETFEIMVEWAEEDKSYEQIARERGLTVAAITQRIFKLKVKYKPRYEEYRRRVVPLLWLGGLAIAAAAGALLYALWRREPPATIEPGPPLRWVVPSASAPPEGTFEPAQPTQPLEPAPPAPFAPATPSAPYRVPAKPPLAPAPRRK